MVEIFREYAEKRNTLTLAELCVRHDVKIKHLLEEFEWLTSDTSLLPEQVLREFLQRAASMVGNMAGKAVTGIGNMTKSFSHGYQQGRGQQPSSEPTSSFGHGYQRQSQQQNKFNRADENEGPLNEILYLLGHLKKNIETWFQKYPDLAQDAPGTTQYIDSITQTLTKVLTDRYGGVRGKFTTS